MRATNLLADLPTSLDAEKFTELLAGRDFRVERIVSIGHATPPGEWYDQEMDEWVLLLAGGAVLRVDGEEEPMRLVVGDALLIPAHTRHSVESTAPGMATVWLAIHFRP